MSNDTKVFCKACQQDADILQRVVWVHRDPYGISGWCFDEGERVEGFYCHECVTDIDNLNLKYRQWLRESHELTEEQWIDLAIILANAYKNAVTNWKDVLTPQQVHALRMAGFGH